MRSSVAYVREIGERHVAVAVVTPAPVTPTVAHDQIAAARKRGVAPVADDHDGVAVGQTGPLAVRRRTSIASTPRISVVVGQPTAVGHHP